MILNKSSSLTLESMHYDAEFCANKSPPSAKLSQWLHKHCWLMFDLLQQQFASIPLLLCVCYNYLCKERKSVIFHFSFV